MCAVAMRMSVATLVAPQPGGGLREGWLRSRGSRHWHGGGDEREASAEAAMRLRAWLSYACIWGCRAPVCGAAARLCVGLPCACVWGCHTPVCGAATRLCVGLPHACVWGCHTPVCRAAAR
eukprot:173228-Chlamydomonas_euryale.AAC.1